MFFVSSRAWDKEKILSPHEEWNLRPSDSALRCPATEPQRLRGERGLLRSSYDTYLYMHRNMYTGKTVHDSVSVCTYSQTFVLS